MEQLLITSNTNQINRYGYQFTVGALTRGIYDTCIDGTPFLIEHDASRLIGWSWPLAVHLAPGLSRAVHLADLTENTKEHEMYTKMFQNHLNKQEIDEQKMKELQRELSTHLHGSESKIMAECVALIDKGLASRAFPEIFSKQDKDGLISLEDLDPIGPGVYQIGQFTVFAHLFFRRNLYPLNSLNYPILEQLHSLNTRKTTAKIALDPDMVGLASTYSGERIELSYWWGPKFTNELANIPVGVTRFEEDDEARRLFSGISRMEFRWGSRKGEHILEAEELRDEPSPLTGNKYGCRFVHSIIKEDTGEIIHFDGSIRMYTEDAMIERLEIDLSRAGRNTEYKKLWRCDGSIEIEKWKRLLSDYYRDNYLVGEYLGAKNPFKETSIDTIKTTSLMDALVPYSIPIGSGIRMAISFKPASDNTSKYDRYVIPMDNMSNGKDTYQYIEPYGIELQKILHRIGTFLHIPKDIRIVTFKDLYANFPLIYHSHNNLPDELEKTLQSIKILVDNWQNSNLDRVLSYKFAFPVEGGKNVYLSFLGHTNDIAHWLTNPLSLPPTTLDQLHNWCEEVSLYLDSEYENNVFDTPSMQQTLMKSGLLLIDRQLLPLDWDIEFIEDSKGLMYGMNIPDKDKHLFNKINELGINPAFAFEIRESHCSKCDSHYRNCNCSKVIDTNIGEHITDYVPTHPFWTDKLYYQ